MLLFFPWLNLPNLAILSPVYTWNGYKTSVIIDETGKHFDPDVVEAFLAGESPFIDIYNQLCDVVPEEE
jgi:hypothetical protein